MSATNQTATKPDRQTRSRQCPSRQCPSIPKRKKRVTTNALSVIRPATTSKPKLVKRGNLLLSLGSDHLWSLSHLSSPIFHVSCLIVHGSSFMSHVSSSLTVSSHRIWWWLTVCKSGGEPIHLSCLISSHIMSHLSSFMSHLTVSVSLSSSLIVSHVSSQMVVVTVCKSGGAPMTKSSVGCV